jgi:hypothetical protein
MTTKPKSPDAERRLADVRDWWRVFCQGRRREEIERIKKTLEVAFPAAPDTKPKSPAARTKRSGK